MSFNQRNRPSKHSSRGVAIDDDDRQPSKKPKVSSSALTSASSSSSSRPSSSSSSSLLSSSSTLSLTSSATQAGLLRFDGSRLFRERLVCSLFSGRPLRIDSIHAEESKPGIKDYEASYLRLLDKITNGTVIQINESGSSVRFIPGLIVGGVTGGIRHQCPPTRSISYFIEPLLRLAPFGKNPLSIIFEGITNDERDLSVDLHRTVTINLLKHFGIEGCEIKIVRRGCLPNGGGEVHLKMPIIKELKPIKLVDEGKIKRIRGLAYTARCSPSFASRLVDGARSVFNNLLADVYIYTDHFKGKESGLSPGYGIALVAESTSGISMSAEVVGAQSGGGDEKEEEGLAINLDAEEKKSKNSMLPEDLGRLCARLLLEEVDRGGVVDSAHQSLMLLLMLLCPEDVSKIRLGKLTSHTIECLRLYRDVFSTQFKMVPDAETGTVLMACLGIGYKNLNRRIA